MPWMMCFSRQVHKYGEYEFPCGDNEVRIDQMSVESALMRSSWHPSAQPCWKWSRTHKGVSLGYRGQSRRRLSAHQIPPVLSNCDCWTACSILGGFSVWLCRVETVCGIWGGCRCVKTRQDVSEVWWGYRTPGKKRKLLVIRLLPWHLFYIINCWCLIKANVGKLTAQQLNARGSCSQGQLWN